MRRKRRRSKTVYSFMPLSRKKPSITLGFILALVLTFFYVFQTTEMAREMYSIQVYNEKVKEALENNRKSDYEFLRANSAYRAEELISEMNFIKVDEAHYINIPDRQVASK